MWIDGCVQKRGTPDSSGSNMQQQLWWYSCLSFVLYPFHSHWQNQPIGSHSRRREAALHSTLVDAIIARQLFLLRYFRGPGCKTHLRRPPFIYRFLGILPAVCVTSLHLLDSHSSPSCRDVGLYVGFRERHADVDVGAVGARARITRRSLSF